MLDHPTDDDLALFVMGALEASAEPAPGASGFSAEALEAHLASCDACAAGLEREARLELALEEVALAKKVVPLARASRLRRFAPALLAATAAAATFVFFALRPVDSDASGPILDVICPDGPSQPACVVRAHRHGLFVAYPSSAGAPRFEELRLQSNAPPSSTGK